MAANAQSKPNYGIDAPGLVRFFFIAGIAALALFVIVLLSPIVGQLPKIVLGMLLGIATTYLLGMGCFMLYGSKVMKLKDRDKLLNLVQWSGRELVLDVGCGRGLMLVGAAERLISGKAIGIDLWQQRDQANNSSAAALSNAVIAGVAERIEVKTADMRQLPFPDNYFDVVLSSWAVHNLEAEADREKALDEMIRVLKPEGSVILADIIYQQEYANYFELRGMTAIQFHNDSIRDVMLKAVTFGSFAPSAVSACKPA
jgi:ubiquinone/menaquinone biosynthesis C-methylase UbiE